MTDEHLSIDDSFVPPEPFDRAIANLEVRCRSNSLEDGLDLDVTISFGADEVRIDLSDGSVLEVMCEVNEAIVVLKTFNCDLAEGERGPTGVGFEYQQNFKGSRSTSRISQAKIGGKVVANAPVSGVDIGGEVGGAMEGSAQSQDCYEVQGERKFSQVQIGTDQIRIYPNPDLSALVGNLLESPNCFKVLPRANNNPFGILTELQVSRGWMKLSNPKPVSVSKKLTALWDKAFNGSDPLDEFHRNAFNLLLEHLVSNGLQANANRKYTTLAARAMRVEKLSSDEIEKRQIGLAERQLRLPVSTVESVLFETREKVENILIEAGVTDFSELGALSSSMIFFPSDSEKDSRLVDLISFLGNSFSVEIGRKTQSNGEIAGSPRLFVPVEFARSFLLAPKSSRRKGCNQIEFQVISDGLYITYMRDGAPLTEVTKRGTFQ